MAAADEVYRESQARLHKTLGAYLLVKAWEIGVDCVVINRSSLLKFLKLERMRDIRIDWLKQDLKDFFPYQFTTVSPDTKTYATLFLSRFDFPPKCMSDQMTVNDRVDLLYLRDLKAEVVEVPEESQIITSMALLANGISTPKDFGA